MDLALNKLQRLICHKTQPTTNINSDDLALPRRHIDALRDLSRNNNVIITPSDEGGGGDVDIMDSVHYKKIME